MVFAVFGRKRRDIARVGIINFMQLGDACVRYGDDADVRLDRAERIIGCLRARLGDRVEQGTLADIRQTDDS